MWFQILSELFVNFAAGWFALVFIEPQTDRVENLLDFWLLIFKFILGILSLVLAKKFREKAE